MKGRLPSFLIIGAQKSGTTTLQRHLRSHPQSYCVAETHFFDFKFDKGLDWYLDQFAPFAHKEVLGEKCPEYLFHPEALDRIRDLIPEARLIVLLRNPVDRAYSHYWHARRVGEETLDFEAALDAETDRIRAGKWNLAYAARGRYLRQLEGVTERFPREALFVGLFEDLRDRPASTFADVCRFIGIDATFVPPDPGYVGNPYREERGRVLQKVLRRGERAGIVPMSVARAVRRRLTRQARYQPMSPKTRERLAKSFEDDNDALARWLGRDLDVWTRAVGTS